MSCAWFFAIEQDRKSPNQNDRSCDEIDEVFDKTSDRVIRVMNRTTKEPGQSQKEWWRNRDRNEKSAKPATTQQSESGRDSRQNRHRPDRCSLVEKGFADTGPSPRRDGEKNGCDEGKPVTITQSINQGPGEHVIPACHFVALVLSLARTYRARPTKAETLVVRSSSVRRPSHYATRPCRHGKFPRSRLGGLRRVSPLRVARLTGQSLPVFLRRAEFAHQCDNLCDAIG